MSDKKKGLGSLIKKKQDKESRAEGRPAKKRQPDRVSKLFRLQQEHVDKFELLKARLKVEQKKTGPQLIEEAIDLLIRKYKQK